MSFNTGQKLVQFKPEVTPGTRLAPVDADHNIRLFDVGEASYDAPANPIGKMADGTFRDGPALSGERKIGFPDCKAEMVWSGDVTVEPVWFTLMKSCGYTVELNGSNPELVWSGQTDCQTLSADLTTYGCGATPTGVVEEARGMVGNAEIGADAAQSPMVIAYSGWMGAWTGTSDVSAAVIPPLVGFDTAPVEKMGNYLATIGGVAYAVQTFKFNPNNEINAEGANNAEGVAKMKVSNQGPRLTMTVTRLSEATDSPSQDLFNDVVHSSITLIGQAGAHFDITFSGADTVELQPSDSNGTATFDITYNVTRAVWAQKV